MKLFIGNEHNVRPYKLPEKIDESFSISYISEVDKEEKMIYIQTESKQWVIYKNQNISLYTSKYPQNKIVLEEFKTFTICFNDCEEYIFLFCLPSKADKYIDYEIPITNKQILIGSNSNNHIIYKNDLVSPNHIALDRDNNGDWWITVAENSPAIYVNDILASHQKLNYGDKIFIFGLKVIWMRSFIRINNIPSLVKVNSLQIYRLSRNTNSKFTDLTSKEKNTNLYKENEYFFHTPSLRPSVENEQISLIDPPEKVENAKTPAFLTIGSSVVMSIVSMITGVTSLFKLASGTSTLEQELLSIVTCVSLAVGTIVFPILTEKYEKNRDKKAEENRIRKYTEYLESKKKIISETILKQEQALKELFPTYEECINTILSKTSDFWSREIKDKEFLSLRLGCGSIPAFINLDYQQKEFTLIEDSLAEETEKLATTELKLNKVPIVESLITNNIYPIIMECSNQKAYIDNLLIQLITYHSSHDLKLVFLVSEKNSYIWHQYKYLSHCISNNSDKRFFATKDEDLKDISSYLETIYQERVNALKNPEENNMQDIDSSFDDKNLYKLFDSYFLIITDDIYHIKNTGIIEKLLKSTKNYGFSLLMFEKNIKNLPSRCENFVDVNDVEAHIFNKEIKSNNQKNFIPEFCNYSDLTSIINKVSNIPIASSEVASQLPTTLEFLEMYKVGKIEQLNIGNRWETNDPTLSLSAPVGVHPDGNLFELNLHEKAHGPHGLIAGSTGSGKSEFIITYILSMCVNYSPNEVQFVLIDYKGGGLAGAFENREKGIKIPHLVGTITNLDTSEMNRTLVSIHSELKRRQKWFNEVRDALGESTIDIYKYQKYYREGAVKEPIAHLFIISDEFAELKAQQPDFMDELISTARIGRSLGVHLILATQKPSGVVDDQIWSNTKFKVCLKVQTAADSVEMLKRPEAASIKETGRFYLQVGYDEIFELGQSAWTGAKYVPTDTLSKKIEDSVEFINDTGTVIKRINNTIKKEEQIDIGEQLTNIVKYLIDLSSKEHLYPNQLWLPSIPNEIYAGNIIKKYNYKPTPYCIEAIIGEYDDPENQIQGLLTQNLAEAGNTIIYGITGCGKENLLTTMLYTTCMFHSPKEVNFYIMDFGAEILKVFNKVPQVGDYVTAYDEDKVNSLFQMLEKEYNRRKELLSEYGSNFTQYVEKNEEKLPLICVILNNYDAYQESYESTEDSLTKLLREGSKMGIIFIITNNSANSISGRVTQNFTQIYALRFNDEFDFRYVLNAEPGQVPKKVFGRGLTTVNEKVLEFQTAYINLADKINDTVKQVAVNLASFYKEKAKPIPVIPGKVTHDTLFEYITDTSAVPLGLSMSDITPATFDFKNNHLIGITGNDLQMGSTFLEEFLKMISNVPDADVVMLDLFRTTDIPSDIKSTTDPIAFMNAAWEAVPDVDDQPDGQRIVIITGVSEIFTDETNAEAKEILVKLINQIDLYPKTTYVLIDNYYEYRKIIVESCYQNKYDETTGIWIGQGVDSQVAFNISGLTSEDSEQYTDDIGYLIKKGKYELIKLMESDES